MFIFLLIFLFTIKFSYTMVIIQNVGIYDIEHDDIAIIFYISVENTFDHKIQVSVNSLKCVEGDPYSDTADYLSLIGGDLGVIKSKRTENLTLIAPNLYLHGKIGKCLISLHFRSEEGIEELREEIYFESEKHFLPDPSGSYQRCTSYDQDGTSNCFPSDCVAKYMSRRSYYNKESKVCQKVPECPPNCVYIPKSNVCRKLHVPVGKADLKLIENGYVERLHSVSNLVNYRCYHGYLTNKSSECVCEAGWSTATCTSKAYHPTLNLHHMCNIELNSWEEANRRKFIMTIIVLTILALAIAAKMLIALCLVNVCCQLIRSKGKEETDEYCGSYNCPYKECNNETCPSNDNRSSKSIRVSFYNIETDPSFADLTMSETESTNSTNKTRSSVCQCKHK